VNLDLFADVEPIAVNPVTGRPYGSVPYFKVGPSQAVAATPTPVERSTAEPPPVPVSVTAVDRSPVAAVAEYPMQPTGQANRWSYRDRLIAYDMARQLVPGRGRWSLVEGIGWPEHRADELAGVVAEIDARMGAA
jgi:hypothetical protein